jgi:hypothetical protein
MGERSRGSGDGAGVESAGQGKEEQMNVDEAIERFESSVSYMESMCLPGVSMFKIFKAQVEVMRAMIDLWRAMVRDIKEARR